VPVEIAAERRPDASRITQKQETAIRFMLVAVAVLLCYQFRWDWLRYWTSELNLRLDALAGVHLQRLSHETVAWGGKIYNYSIACTFADVFCGSIPLLWNLRKNVGYNFGRIAIWALVLFVFNVVRLSFSDVMFAQGLSWDLAHNVVSGISYFLIWIYLWKNRPF
jgi:hypothetical protein